MTHPILKAHSAFVEWEDRGKTLQKRREALARQILAAQESQARRDTDHERQLREAVEKAKAIPPKPERIDMTHLDAAMSIQRADEEAHRRQRSAVLVRVAEDGGLLGVEDRLGSSLSRISAVADELRSAKADVESTLLLLRDLLTEADRERGVMERPRRGDRIRTKWTLDDLLRADVADLIRLQPVERTPGERIMPADDHDSRRTIAEHNRLMAAEIARQQNAPHLGLRVDADPTGVFGARPVPAPAGSTRPGEI